MSNKIKISIYFISFLCISCSKIINHKRIHIRQEKENFPVIIRTAKDNNDRILRAQFPKSLKIKNLSNKEFIISRIYYTYNDFIPESQKGYYGISLFKKDNNQLYRVGNKKALLKGKQSIEYTYYTRHFVDSSKATQDIFEPYKEKMLKENKDTLHIGTVMQFKQKHPEVFERLTDSDSISIQFLDGNKFGERITVPVEW